MFRFVGVFRLVAAPLLAMATLGLAAPAASAAPAPVKFNANLAALWTTCPSGTAGSRLLTR
jgi:hypothetical protein